MMTRYGKRLAAVVLLTALLAMLISPAIYAAGLWWGFPLIGGSSYCVSYSIYPTTTTTGLPSPVPTPNQCNGTAPAGPTTFSGTEAFPVDIYGPQASGANTVPTSAYTMLVQVGQGPYSDVGSPTSATIPNNTPFYFLDGTQSSNFTITMPSAPIEGQIQRVICEKATSGALNVAANTGQTLLNNPSTACVVGVAYAWRYVAASTSWYRF